MDKRGVFFSVDATIALMIIFLSILVIYPSTKNYNKESFVSEVSKDFMKVSTVITMKELEDSQILVGIVDDDNNPIKYNPDMTLIEQVTEYYLEGETKVMNDLLKKVFPDTKDNLGLWVTNEIDSPNIFTNKLGRAISNNPNEDLEIKSSYENSENIIVEKIIIKIIKADSYKTYMKYDSQLKTDNHLLGGYVGDGRIEKIIRYHGSIQEVKINIATNNIFSIKVNDDIMNGNSNCPYTPVYDSDPQTYTLNCLNKFFSDFDNKILIMGI